MSTRRRWVPPPQTECRCRRNPSPELKARRRVWELRVTRASVRWLGVLRLMGFALGSRGGGEQGGASRDLGPSCSFSSHGGDPSSLSSTGGFRVSRERWRCTGNEEATAPAEVTGTFSRVRRIPERSSLDQAAFFLWLLPTLFSSLSPLCV